MSRHTTHGHALPRDRPQDQTHVPLLQYHRVTRRPRMEGVQQGPPPLPTSENHRR